MFDRRLACMPGLSYDDAYEEKRSQESLGIKSIVNHVRTNGEQLADHDWTW
jgi:hypothetical protein